LIIPIEMLAERYALDLAVVLHLGAHLGEEAEEYRRAGAEQVIWVEADPEVAARLAVAVEPFGHRAIQAVISDRDGDYADFFVASNDGRSSSLLTMNTHRQQHPEIVVTGAIRLRTTTIDSLCERGGIDRVDLITMDLQGAELLALRGGARSVESTRYIYTEVNVDDLYTGCPRIEALDAYLGGFTRLETALTPYGWGDAFYLRSDLVPPGAEPHAWIA
jgi:FkbM family methyltransferase